ncbi:MAG: sigma-54 dependent transcriptional regulator, partial [Polyangiaceae bacterium]|nr:sigma-54 dependent transcriptional regulator [Polyangiaceae bacterium]
MASSQEELSSGSYILEFTSGCASLVQLPDQGSFDVGSGVEAEAGLTLNECGLPARAARIILTECAASLERLDPDVDLLVNGKRLGEATALTSGDAISVGCTSFVFHRDPGKARCRLSVPLGQFQDRLAEEAERFLRHGRTFSVLTMLLGAEDFVHSDLACQAVRRAVRVVDVLGGDGRPEMLVLFPETDESAEIPAARVIDALRSEAPSVRGGLARCPWDAIAADDIITAARAAAQHAEVGQVQAFGQLAFDIAIGEGSVVAVDPMMRRLFDLVERVASSDIPILILGETGAGKEVVAQAVHAWSKRRRFRMLAVNCAAVPESLLESELFGHERGAFSGAVAAKAGIFEAASGGTVFLDEIGDCSPRTQAELLRVLETKTFFRVGSTKELSTNVRVIAATNRPLEEAVDAGRFRRDLYYRLNAATVIVPPLRDRPLDVPVLVRRFLEEACARNDVPALRLSASALRRLLLHRWPGNVRELKNHMDYLAATVRSPTIDAFHLPVSIAQSAAPWIVAKPSACAQAPSPPKRPTAGAE